jgi:fructose-specific component phosphotransferase system IIB-like protein
MASFPMMPTWRVITVTAALGAVLGSALHAHAALDGPLAPIIASFQAKASPDQAKQLTDAITASPPLQARLERLAASGVLKGVDLVTQEDERLDEGKGAEVVGGHILLTAKFLLGQPPRRRTDATSKGDLEPPDNLVFSLSHLSYHLENPVDRKTLPQSQDARVNIFVRDEAKAYIQGWNDLIDAEARLKGRPITAAEAASLLTNFKYRSFFIKANGKLAVVSPDGHLEPNGRNLQAMTSALFESDVPDFQ